MQNKLDIFCKANYTKNAKRAKQKNQERKNGED